MKRAPIFLDEVGGRRLQTDLPCGRDVESGGVSAGEHVVLGREFVEMAERD